MEKEINRGRHGLMVMASAVDWEGWGSMVYRSHEQKPDLIIESTK